MDSILKTIRKMVLGLPINSEDSEEEIAFDTDLIIHINTAFSVLNQLGVGPKGGFFITGVDSKWSDFIGESKAIEMVKTYVYLKTKLAFDPPQNGTAVELMKEQCREYEWRAMEACEGYSFD